MLPAFRLAIGACAIATATVVTVAHAATPISLPLEDLGLDNATAIELPVPPPPQVVRPAAASIRLVIKRQVPPGCQGEGRKSAGERRQVAAPGLASPASDPWVTTPVWFRLG